MSNGSVDNGHLTPEQKRARLADLLKQKAAAPRSAPEQPAALLVDGPPSIDLLAEATLEPDILARHPVRPLPNGPRRLLLTGATGFLGAYLLESLLELTNAEICCVVRAKGGSGVHRVRENLRSYGKWQDRWADRIQTFNGDLAQPRIGLSPADYEELAETVDVIYHNGATVNFAWPYNALKQANVGGTQEVLRLAIQSRTRPVHFVSSLGVYSSADYTGKTVREDEPLVTPEFLDCGYVQTKWVTDKLLTVARSRGIPASIYRVGLLTGDSTNGLGSTDGLIARMIKGCIQLGCAPDIDIRIEAVPVDYVGAAIAHLSLKPELLGGTYHLANPTSLPWNQLVDYLRIVGYSLRTVPYDEWREALLKDARQSTDNAMYALVPVMQEPTSQERLFSNAGTPVISCDLTVAALSGSDISCAPFDAELLTTYLNHFYQTGFLSPPGEPQAAAPGPAERR